MNTFSSLANDYARLEIPIESVFERSTNATQYESAAAGCVPLIMMDGVESAYEELLPYSSFALRMNDSLRQIATLEPLLRAVPAARVAAMRAELRCLWPRLLWLRHDGAQTPLPNQDKLLK